MTSLPLSDESVTVSPESLVKVKSGAGSPTVTSCSLLASCGRRRPVSRVGDRDGERFVSPSEQRERIASACERDGLELVDVLEELDVSGGAPLARRPGLRRAVELIENGEADVVVVAYLDRLVRSLTVQAEVVGRVEAAGGGILAVDVGQVTNGTATQWLSGTTARRRLRVRSPRDRRTDSRRETSRRRARRPSVPERPARPPAGRGRPPRAAPEQAAVVAEAFRRARRGATIAEVREYLREHGIERSYHGVQALLGSRIYLGELRFGDIVNPSSHPAIVDAATWQRVQSMRAPARPPADLRPSARTPGHPPLRHLRRAHGDRLHRPERQALPLLPVPAGRRLPEAGHDQRHVAENAVVEHVRERSRG